MKDISILKNMSASIDIAEIKIQIEMASHIMQDILPSTVFVFVLIWKPNPTLLRNNIL